MFGRFPVLSWAKGRLKCTEESQHHSLAPPYSCLFFFFFFVNSSRPPFFPPLESPLVIFPTHRPIIVPYVSGRSDLIGCVGVVCEVRAVFISHSVLLDSFQQHPPSSRTQSVGEEEKSKDGKKTMKERKRRRQLDEKGRILLYAAFSMI